MIEIQNLTKFYGKTKGVENLSLKLYKGEIFGFIGPNGAGKSTTIRSIMNLINKTSGRVLIDNKEFNKDDVELKRIIGYLPSKINLYDDLTVKEMFDYHESFYKNNIHKRRVELVKRFKLDENKKTLGLSLGIVFVSYVLNIISEMSESTEVLKYLSIFTLADIRNVIINTSINYLTILITILITFLFIFLTYIFYNKKEFV